MTCREYFRGWPIKRIVLPNGDRFVCTYAWDGTEPYRTNEEANHNIFRLDPNGTVVWQVRRDERGALDLEAGLAVARANGTEQFYSTREPFMTLDLVYADGTNNMSKVTYTYPETDIWVPGCTVRSSSLSGHGYVIDIDTGIATNVTGRGRRAW